MLALFSGKTYVRIANAWDVTDLPGTGSTGDRRYTAHWDFNPAIIAALDPTPNADFLDVSRVDWFYYDVRYVCENGLMNGTSRNRFSPYGTVTRRPCPITRCPLCAGRRKRQARPFRPRHPRPARSHAAPVSDKIIALNHAGRHNLCLPAYYSRNVHNYRVY